ncbi:MAG: TM2 domain-containing protein [Planctomycetota bacterium]
MTDEQQPSQAPPPPANGKPAGADKKVLVGVLGILLGWLGIHKFVLGYTLEGCIMLGCSILGGIGCVCLLFPGAVNVAIWGIAIAEGIIYLTKSDEEFVATYIDNKKGWF